MGIFSVTVDQNKLRFFEIAIFVDIIFLMVIFSAIDFIIFCGFYGFYYFLWILLFLWILDLVKQTF